MKLKNVWIMIIGIFVLLCVVTFGIVGVSRAMDEVNDALMDAGSNNENNDTGADPDNGENSAGEEEPEPVKFMMRSEPEFAFNNATDNSYTGIRFITDVPATLVKNLNENEAYKAYCLIAPLDYFEQVYDESASSMDWVSAFSKAGLTFLKIPCKIRNDLVDGGINYVFSAVIEEIKYTNTNRAFTAVSSQ